MAPGVRTMAWPPYVWALAREKRPSSSGGGGGRRGGAPAVRTMAWPPYVWALAREKRPSSSGRADVRRGGPACVSSASMLHYRTCQREGDWEPDRRREYGKTGTS